MSEALYYHDGVKKEVIFSDVCKIIILNLHSNEKREIPFDGKFILTSVLVDSTEKYLSTLGKENNFIYIYNFTKATFIRQLPGHSSRITCQVYLPNLGYLATGANDNCIIIWDYKGTQETAKESKKKTLIGHSLSITALCLTADQEKLISGSKDCTIKV